jgi:hypothetical protein
MGAGPLPQHRWAPNRRVRDRRFPHALTPAALDAAHVAAQQLETDRESALAQWRLVIERTRYEAERAERRYHAVEPENRLVAVNGRPLRATQGHPAEPAGVTQIEPPL